MTDTKQPATRHIPQAERLKGLNGPNTKRRTAMKKLTVWSNRLGYTLRSAAGEWDLCHDLRGWIANFRPVGDREVTKSGEGETISDAINNAKPVAIR